MKFKRVSMALLLLSFAWLPHAFAQSGSDGPLTLSPGLNLLAEKVLRRFSPEAGKSIAVAPFLELDGKTTYLGVFISERLSTKIIELGYDVVERSRLDAAIRELDLNKGAAFDSDNVKRLGRQVGASYILTGTISELATFVELNSRLFDAATGNGLGAGQVQLVKDQDLLAILGKGLGAQPMDDDGFSIDNNSTVKEQKPQSLSQNGAKIELVGCQLDASQLLCSGYVTLSREEHFGIFSGQNPIYDPSKLVDPDGNEIMATRVRLGSAEHSPQLWTDPVANARLRLELTFEDVPENLTEIPVVLVSTSLGRFSFRKVKVSQ